MKWLKRLGISLTIAFFGIACGAVLVFNWGALGWKALSVPTGSMRPSIPPGSVVLMHRVPNSTLRVGDVITYANPLIPGTTITHRIVNSSKLNNTIPVFITKGDANKVNDRPVVGGQVQGKAVWHAPYIGKVLSWSKTWAGIAILVYLPAAVIMWGAAVDMADYMRKFRLYELKLFPKTRRRFQLQFGRRAGAATLLSALFILILGTVAGPVSALLRSNTVALSPNNLRVAPIVTPPPPPPPPPACTTGGNSTTVIVTNNGSGSSSSNSTTINNSNSQTATSGNATSSGNTNGGSAISGNATNTNCTIINVTNTNH